MYEATSSEDLSRRMIEKGLWGQEGSRPGSPAEQASKDQDLLGGAPIDINVSDIVEGRQPRFAGDRGVDNRGTSAPERSATDAARERPNAAGPGAPTASRSHQPDAEPSDPASTGPGKTQRTGEHPRDPRLDSVRETINHLDRRIQLEGTRERAIDELDRARVRQLPFTAQRAQARQASEQFRRAVAEVYRDPVAARRAFHAQAGEIAAAELRRHPERFGELRGTQLGPVRSAERAAALQSVPKLEHLGSEDLHRVREAWANRAEYRQARATVVHLERRIRGLDSELTRDAAGSAVVAAAARATAGQGARGRLQSADRAVPTPEVSADIDTNFFQPDACGLQAS